MVKPFTIATPRYHIRNTKGYIFNVFKRKTNAIAAAIEMATEHPGNTFIVSKTVNGKQKNIFTMTIDIQSDLIDFPEIYESIIKIFQKKVARTAFWRKAEVKSV